MLDTWSLQVLVTVARHGSFSAAAEALSMTQPAVSRQVAGLERKVGLRLFTRATRGVHPTPAGEAAIRAAQECLDRLRDLETLLASFADMTSGELRLCGFSSANVALVPAAIRRFAKVYPGVSLSLLPPAPEPLNAVRQGLVDLALVTDWHLYQNPYEVRDDPAMGDHPLLPTDGLELVPLMREHLHVALPEEHPLARQSRVRLADLRDETWINGAFPDCLGPIAPLASALGAAPKVGFWCDDWHSKQALVATGAGIMLVPTLAHDAVRQGTVVRPTIPPLPPRGLYAAVVEPQRRAPAVAAMLRILTELTVP